MQVNVHEAKTQLSKLIEAAMRGEEVTIARDNKPMVRLVPVPQTKPKFKFGILKGLNPPDFLAPMSEEDLRDWE